MHHLLRAGAVGLALCGTAAAPPPSGDAPMSETTPQAPPAGSAAAPPSADAPSIGEASMQADGTILLHLRAVSPGAIGDALLRYPPDHPQYRAILAHLGGLAPGEHKPVAPFD